MSETSNPPYQGLYGKRNPHLPILWSIWWRGATVFFTLLFMLSRASCLGTSYHGDTLNLWLTVTRTIFLYPSLSKIYFSVNLIFSGARCTLISPGFVSANKQVCRRGKAKSIGIWRRMEKIPIPLFLLHSDFFTEMFGYLYSYYYGANINSGWNEIFQIHQCMKISTPYHDY